MPIRFRCAYCRQLMGIARRKAGTIVRCPTCSGQVIVPTPPPESHEPLPMAEVFERSDFDVILQDEPQTSAVRQQVKQSAAVNGPAPAGGGSPTVGTLEAGSADEFLPTVPGIVLTPGKLILLILVGLLFLMLAFFGGLVVGRSIESTPEPQPSNMHFHKE